MLLAKALPGRQQARLLRLFVAPLCTVYKITLIDQILSLKDSIILKVIRIIVGVMEAQEEVREGARKMMTIDITATITIIKIVIKTNTPMENMKKRIIMESRIMV